jgi:beta-glucosidase
MRRSSLPRRASRLGAGGACVALCALLVGAPAAVAGAPKRVVVTRAMLAQRPWLSAELTPQQRAQMLLEQMTLPEKVDLMTGNQGEAPYAFYNAPIVRLGIPALKMSDSASGVHAHGWSLVGTGEHATAMPSAQALGATWSTDAISSYAAAVTDETRATGHNVLLSPVGDIFRTPWFGRINESPSEDPIMTAKFLGRYTQVTQSQHVIAVLKHYLAYNQETNRMAAGGQNSIVDTARCGRSTRCRTSRRSARATRAVRCAPSTRSMETTPARTGTRCVVY